MKKTLKMMALMVCAAVLFTACGKSSTTNHELQTKNLVSNGDFEKGTTSPDGWHTHNQFLNDVTGWATDEVHSGKHSLKIENIGGTSAYWEGEPIVFDTPTRLFSASVWSMGKDIKGEKGICQLVFDVVFLKENEAKQRVFVSVPTTKLGWQQISQRFLFASDIKMIIPYFMFSGALGSVWFDDLNVNAIQIDWGKANTLFDTNKGGKFTGTFEKGEGNSLTFKGKQAVFSTDFIPVNPNKVYSLSGEFKSLGSQKSVAYFGFAAYYDKNKQPISIASQRHIPKTETELIKSCKATDKTVIVKNASSWSGSPLGCIAFNIDDSGQYKDIPNFNLSPFGIDKIEKFGQFWKISLSKEIGCNYPAKTKIRQHSHNDKWLDPYVYSALNGLYIPNSWTQYQSVNGLRDINLGFYLGAQFIKVLLFVNYDDNSNSILSVRNIKLQESSIEN